MPQTSWNTGLIIPSNTYQFQASKSCLDELVRMNEDQCGPAIPLCHRKEITIQYVSSIIQCEWSDQTLGVQLRTCTRHPGRFCRWTMVSFPRGNWETINWHIRKQNRKYSPRRNRDSEWLVLARRDVVATLNQRHWRWFNVATTSCAKWGYQSKTITGALELGVLRTGRSGPAQSLGHCHRCTPGVRGESRGVVAGGGWLGGAIDSRHESVSCLDCPPKQHTGWSPGQRWSSGATINRRPAAIPEFVCIFNLWLPVRNGPKWGEPDQTVTSSLTQARPRGRVAIIHSLHCNAVWYLR